VVSEALFLEKVSTSKLREQVFPMDPPSGPPARERLLFELFTAREAIRLPLRLPGLLRKKAEAPSTILLVPGLGATDTSLLPLRTFLRRAGHDARSIGLGRINDNVEVQYLRVADVVVQAARAIDRPVVLIGWSIGGVLVREAARDHPDLVRRVFTFGTPVVGGPAYSQVARRYSIQELETVKARVDERSEIPLPMPITAIWSRFDGIVEPAACFDRKSARVEHVEVRSTHMGMGVDPDVWSAISLRLGEV
jgi:triacylglycerol esterase/lipase EstA (alpha/beta hydrolase family)